MNAEIYNTSFMKMINTVIIKNIRSPQTETVIFFKLCYKIYNIRTKKMQFFTIEKYMNVIVNCKNIKV